MLLRLLPSCGLAVVASCAGLLLVCPGGGGDGLRKHSERIIWHTAIAAGEGDTYRQQQTREVGDRQIKLGPTCKIMRVQACESTAPPGKQVSSRQSGQDSQGIPGWHAELQASL